MTSNYLLKLFFLHRKKSLKIRLFVKRKKYIGKSCKVLISLILIVMPRFQIITDVYILSIYYTMQ